MDLGIFGLSLLMLGFGIVLVYSSSFAVAQQKYGGSDFFLARQAVRAIIALACFVVFINVDYHAWIRLGNLTFAGAIVLLLYVLVAPNAQAVKGARRWVSLGFVTFQVSEVARMALVVFLARKLGEAGDSIRQWKVLVRHLLFIGIVCGLIVLEPDFSTALLVGVVGISLLFVAGAHFLHLTMIFVAGVPVAIIAMLSTSYRFRRVLAFFNPGEYKETIGYQAHQAMIGLGNGGVFGQGLGQGQQKYFYLPEPHTDFVFSILGEEIGFVGMVIVLAMFAYMIFRGIRVAMNAPDKEGQLMAFGFTIMLAVYVVLHSFVNTGLVPTTGVPLPLLSYGGMSLVFTMSAIGILLNISSQCQETPATTGSGRRKK